MIARAHRITADRDIKRICKAGRRFGVPELTFFIAPNRIGLPRFTVVVGSTVSKKAVMRNRIKRQVRDVMRRAIKTGAISRGVDLVAVVRPVCVAIPDRGRVLFIEQTLMRLKIARAV